MRFELLFACIFCYLLLFVYEYGHMFWVYMNMGGSVVLV